MLNLNNGLERIEISIIRKLAEQCRNLNRKKQIINLTIGEPDLPQPTRIIDGVADLMKSNRLGYPPVGGIPELKQEIVNFYKERYGIELTNEEIIITVGSTEGLSTAIKTILNPKDEVILTLPLYPGYEPLIILNGGIPIKIDITKSNFELNIELLKKYVTPKTKAIILNYPMNPTGATISKKNRDDILKFAKENNIFIISDEVYSELTFDKNHISFLKDDFRDNVILVNGLSKSHSLTGWRIGYVIASTELIKQLVKVHQYTVTSTSIISQYSGLIAFRDCKETPISHTEIYKKRAELVYNILTENGVEAFKSKGGIYVFFSIKKFTTLTSLEFAYKLLEETGVALVPGIAFGVEGYMRISLIKEINILEEAINKVVNYLRECYK